MLVTGTYFLKRSCVKKVSIIFSKTQFFFCIYTYTGG